MRYLLLCWDINDATGAGRFAQQVRRIFQAKGSVAIAQELNPPHDQLVIIRRRWGILQSALQLIWRRKEFDHIVALDVYPMGCIAWLVSKITRKPYTVYALGTYSIAPLHSWWALIARWVIQDSSRSVAISSFTRRQIEQAGQVMHEVCHPEVPVAFWASDVRTKMHSPPAIISVGAIKVRKGYHVALEAYALARAEISGLIWHIVGSPHDRSYVESLKRRAQELGVSDGMRWHQNISNEELRDLYVASDVFVFPAVNDGWHVEGFGIVCIEAQAAGLPVVTSVESGTEDTVRNGETGILVAQNDITGVATAIISLLRSNEAYSRFSNAARAWAMRFDVT